jgi:hypothetical protein
VATLGGHHGLDTVALDIDARPTSRPMLNVFSSSATRATSSTTGSPPDLSVVMDREATDRAPRGLAVDAGDRRRGTAQCLALDKALKLGGELALATVDPGLGARAARTSARNRVSHRWAVRSGMPAASAARVNGTPSSRWGRSTAS